METLQRILGSDLIFLDKKNIVAVFRCNGEPPRIKPIDQMDVSLDEYLEMLNHFVVEPHLDYQIKSRQILAYGYLMTQLWCDIYNRYGRQIFKILTGSYQVFQLLPSTNCYIQISGQSLSTSLRSSVPHKSNTSRSLCTQSTPTTQSTGMSTRTPSVNTHNPPSGTATIGTHMFANQTQPKTSPDRVYGNMSYTRWYKSIFNMEPTVNNPCEQLKLLHKNLRNLAFDHFVRVFCKEHARRTNQDDVFEHMVPHWKIKQLIKRILTQLKLCLLIPRKECYKKILDRLQMLFTSNLYTKFKTSFLSQDIKISECKWLYSFSSYSAKDKRIYLTNLLLWITKAINHVIRYFFYVTESRTYRKRTLFFLRSYWEEKVGQTLQSYEESKVLKKVTVKHNANTHLRFLAGQNKLRPILSSIKKEISSKVHYHLKDVLECLKFLRSDPNTGLAKCTDILKYLRAFCSTKHLYRYYFVKADITKCYDSINRKLLLNILKGRLTQMNVQRFACWSIAVILPGWSKPSITYFNHVHVNTDYHTDASKSVFDLNTMCQEYLQKKGIDSGVLVPLKTNYLSTSKVIETIESHLNDVLIQVKMANGTAYKYAMIDGIPQGSILSAVLCDIYYGAMEREFMQPCLQRNDSLLLRNTDDYLLLASSEVTARQFLNTLTFPSLAERYSCVIKLEKTLTNISMESDCISNRFPRSDDVDVQWCQYVINLSHLTVELPFYSIQEIQNGISYNGTVKPVEYIKGSLLKHISVFGNPVFFDPVINDADTIKQNIMKVLRLCAVKFTYLHSHLVSYCGHLGVARDPKLWLKMVQNVGRKIYKVVRNHHIRQGDVLELDEMQIAMLCLEQFYMICGSWKELKPLRDVIKDKLAALRAR